jgi:aryl-alcohol dehydrogenase-like predicted oxidoreductase
MTAASVRLGDGLNVSPLGFGGMALTPVYGEVDPAEALATLHHAVDAGMTFIDTADIYGGGSNEELISQLLKERRGEVQLATKFALVGTPSTGYSDIRGDAAYVKQAVDRSLQRLGTDTIDLYYMHRRDLRVPIVETVEAMAELVRAGKAKHLGLSEVTAEELREASTVHPIAAVQSEWSIWSRDVERNVVPAAAQLGVGLRAVLAARPGIPHRHGRRVKAGQQRLPPQHPAFRRSRTRSQPGSCCRHPGRRCRTQRRRAHRDAGPGGPGVAVGAGPQAAPARRPDPRHAQGGPDR